MLPYFSELLTQLADRTKLGTISRLSFASVPLRRHLLDVFSRPFGENGSFLSNPLFEAVFGWQTVESTIQELAGKLLSPELVNAMDAPPHDLIHEYRFSKDQRPYKHQLQAWQTLRNPIPQSVVVASGTGSGKTECFMVPILDHLARVRAEKRCRLTGVRALFLYPLNALINSQRDRLRAWTYDFEGDLRFCLYNGNTPEKVQKEKRQKNLNEVMDRETLRASPPPILVTNATMLEYMLVRTADKPILDQSQGKLEWVVLDEAHTYIGSQAAELALLIRRVLFAFGVRSENVRFVATSATIGDPNGEAGMRLRRFLAEVAGVDFDRVHLIAGERQVPLLPKSIPSRTDSIESLWSLDNGQERSQARYDALAVHSVARRLRDIFVANIGKPLVARLSEICKVTNNCIGSPSLNIQKEALRWLDLLSGTRDEKGLPFLPLRAHLFHQTLSGLWACASTSCPNKHESLLDDENWFFGQVYFEPRKHCLCGNPAYEVVTCGDCGEVYLLAGETNGLLTHLQAATAIDEFELDIEPEEMSEENEETPINDPWKQSRVLIVNRDFVQPKAPTGLLGVESTTRRITEAKDGAVRLTVCEDVGNGLICPACGEQEKPRKPLFRMCRIGAPFLLGNILPSLLEFAPDGDKPADHPYRGRRLLTFNDSRQGTARMAAKLQQDAERNRVRTLIYHIALQHGISKSGQNAAKLRDEIDKLKAAQHPALAQLIIDKEAELALLSQPTPIPFVDLAQYLVHQGQDFERMLNHYKKYAPDTFGSASGPLELARMFLVREFGRRPKRQNNLETMGMVAVFYPDLNNIKEVPPIVAQAAPMFTVSDWRDFLKLSIDFFVRAGSSLEIDQRWLNWLGMSYWQTWIVSRDERDVARRQRRWVRAKRSGLRSTLVRLLAYVLQVDIQTAYGEDVVDAILQEAWDVLNNLGLFHMTASGRVVPLTRLAFTPINIAWVCPFTRRFLDTTLKGATPYLPLNADGNKAFCKKVGLPVYDEPFGRLTDDLERVRRARVWQASQSVIISLREEGLWSDLNDRIIEMAPFFTAAEHSAQQDAVTLEAYEKAFKSGDLNLLSCSTTMEMGIDIGGMAIVAMNNVPPHPANYLQRAGRAGRRQETRSIVMTLCKSNPHDQAVFSNSRWAFDTPLPAPQVALDSPIIVQRHVNAFLLTHFLAQQIGVSNKDKSKLTCGWFFTEDTQMAVSFVAWCRAFDQDVLASLAKGMQQLMKHSVLEGHSVIRPVFRAAEEMDQVRLAWIAEWEALNMQEREICSADAKNDPGYKAIMIHKERLTGEYLLRELATKGFLPSYGFPTHITTFDNLTIGQLKKIRANKEKGREDNLYRRRELASRSRVTALREYAPGAEVVMDGLVYRSAGITLNWHIPASLQHVREIQSIRFAWRCHFCGASGSSHSLDASQHCDACGENIRATDIREFLEPAGFAVDLYEDPHNDVTHQHFVPVEAPWISTRGDWYFLSNPILGRFRTTPRGHVFSQSRGIYGEGYALCLLCGRAEPIIPGEAIPAGFQRPHRKLRGGQGGDSICSGSYDQWKIKTGLALGHEAFTDVLELQLKTENGIWLQNRIAAMTLSVALRDAIAKILGVQATELGCDVKEAKPEPGVKCLSILIYDIFSAGYSSSAERFINEVFAIARARLQCSVNCDSACPNCILDFDQRFAADYLNRQTALDVLTENWMNSLALPENLAFFGPGSRPEYARLSEAIWRETGDESTQVRLFAGGVLSEWDIGVSQLRKLAYRLAGQEKEVTIVLSKTDIESAEDIDLHSLASLADHPRINVLAVNELPVAKGSCVLAEVECKKQYMRWASEDTSAFTLGPSWGLTATPLIKAAASLPLNLAGQVKDASSLRPKYDNLGDKELTVHHELDGPLQGFGLRFWTLITDQHLATKNLLSTQAKDIISIRYQDRYLFTPLSIALLSELINSLRERVGDARWTSPIITIMTTRQRSFNNSVTRNLIWADWPSIELRDKVIKDAFTQLGMNIHLQVEEKSATQHGRLFEIELDGGIRISIRLDQGVSYWRAATSREGSKSSCRFNFSLDSKAQACSIAKMKILVEGANQKTEIFVKVR